MKLHLIIFTYICLIGSAYIHATPAYAQGGFSFAEEYKSLRVLLEKVTTRELAEKHKPAIEEEIAFLNATQTSGSEIFSSLSSAEKELFVKKFQNNRFHCGEVTSVMDERRRILLHPELSSVLRETLNKIP